MGILKSNYFSRNSVGMNRLLSYGILPSLSTTKCLHAMIIAFNITNISQLLIISYLKHNDPVSSRILLLQIETQQTAILYNSLIRCHAQSRQFFHAYSIFKHMLRSYTKPDSFSFATMLRACGDNFDLTGIKALHGVIVSSGFGLDIIPIATLVSNYSKFGLLDDAINIFNEISKPDLVVYNTMLSGFGYGGLWQNGFELFHKMRNGGCNPDGYSLVGLISCFWDLSSFQLAKGVHGYVLKGGFESNTHVTSVLLSMYTRLNCLDSAYQIFRKIANPDLVTWSAVITGFIQNGMFINALVMFKEMVEIPAKSPDTVLIASILSACSSISAIRLGKQIHCYAFRHEMDSDLAVSCALTDLYCKCGFAHVGLHIFNTMQNKSSVLYNAVIFGLGSNGYGLEAVSVFEEMLRDGFKPDQATFSGILCACSHSGLLADGLSIFGKMKDGFGIEPEIEHYVYVVKLMALAGKLDEAYELIMSMPELEGTRSGVWGALLWGCGLHGRSDLAEIASQMLLEIDPGKSVYKVMISNVYAHGGKWGNAESLRERVNKQKVTGLSWI